jgi:hypothetical protein
MQPHQQRVVDEKAELDTKRIALAKFLDGEVVVKLPEVEQKRLAYQLAVMTQYSEVLGHRIADFK